MARASTVAKKNDSTPVQPPIGVLAARERRQGFDQIGARLREAREARGLSLREIARRISVSPSFVSQVETGKASPSVGTLYSLVNELGLSLDEVMSDEPTTNGRAAGENGWRDAAAEGGHGDAASTKIAWDHETPSMWPRVGSPLQRAAGRPTIRLSGVTWERLTHEDDPFVDFLYVTYAPGASSAPDDRLMRHGGREYGHVISGRIDVQVGFEKYSLGPGDSLHFDSMTPHRLANPYEEACVAVWVVVARNGDTRVVTARDPDSSHLPGLM
jgi:transcriptional regulator with XRE-family HTH domain/quercetin dioxygenase-like cupin family protein